ncbi:MAG: ATP-dependent DNA ligase [Leifsonia sp.]
MGKLLYGSMTVEFDDRVLSHLQIVIVNKLRRNESFAMSWRDSSAVGDGRSAIWIDPSIPLYFKFDGSRVPEIDREWLARLSASADSSLGLIVTDEEGGPVGALPDLAVAGSPGKTRATRAPRER